MQTIADSLEPGADPLVKRYLGDHLRRLAWRQQLAAGEWVDLLEHGLEGWDPSRGRWEAAEDGGVIGHYIEPVREGDLRLILPLDLPDRYIVEAEVQLPDNWYDGHWKGAGLLLDARLESTTRDTRFCFIERQRRVWINDDGRGGSDYRYFPRPDLTTALSMTVIVDGPDVQLRLGDLEPVDYRFEAPGLNGGRLAIGALGYHQECVGPIHFKTLLLRWLAPPGQLRLSEGPGAMWTVRR